MLEGRTVLITGGLGLIGRALATAIEARGGTPVLTTRDADRAAAFNDEAAGTRAARARQLKFRDAREIAALMAATAEEFGGVQGLVNNAFARQPYRSVEETSWADWEEAMRCNVGYAHSCSVAAMGQRATTKIESIVNVSSIYGLIPPNFAIYPPGKTPTPVYYGASKAALIQLTRYLAVYWAGDEVRVNSVSLGGVLNHQDQVFIDAYAAHMPGGRMIEPEEAAAAICQLLGPESKGISGTNVIIDGGLHAS